MTEEEFRTIQEGDRVVFTRNTDTPYYGSYRQGETYTVGGSHFTTHPNGEVSSTSHNFIPTVENNDGTHYKYFEFVNKVRHPRNYRVTGHNTTSNCVTLGEAREKARNLGDTCSIWKRVEHYKKEQLT